MNPEIISHYVGKLGNETSIPQSLTEREKEVSACLLCGMTAKQVSRKLGISVHTVEGYQRKIKKKLHGKTPYQVGGILGKILDI